jgi:hypothetical protein
MPQEAIKTYASSTAKLAKLAELNTEIQLV